MGRSADICRLADRIHKIPDAIHCHADLIAGVPFETFQEFCNSFNYAFDLHGEMLQLGFLKILPGTKMNAIAESYADYLWSHNPPYEVLETSWLRYSELCVLKDIEFILDSYYNSGLLRKTIDFLCASFKNAADILQKAAVHMNRYFNNESVNHPHKPAALFMWCADLHVNDAREWLMFDSCMHGKQSGEPLWRSRNYNKDKHVRIASQYYSAQYTDTQYPLSVRVMVGKTEYERLTFSNGTSIDVLFVYSEQPYAAYIIETQPDGAYVFHKNTAAVYRMTLQ